MKTLILLTVLAVFIPVHAEGIPAGKEGTWTWEMGVLITGPTGTRYSCSAAPYTARRTTHEVPVNCTLSAGEPHPMWLDLHTGKIVTR